MKPWREIARRVGLAYSTVATIVSRLSIQSGTDNGAIALASASLLAAIQRHHPEELLRQPGRRL